mmetsp:Transcript_21609/g.31756  ORF Transcript_21609/g.31756 Transcript_21609/m.31756 type:complete len:331 (+) Transcript_21609:31-1023(+)
MKTANFLSFLFVGTFAAVVAEKVAPELCGECWCIPDEGDSCPAFGNGITNKLDQGVVEILNSFALKNEFELKSADGGPCNPVPANGIVLPECVGPDIPSGPYVSCAMKFTGEGCCGREYELVNYVSDDPDISQVNNESFVITHREACGVCSSAQDLAILGTGIAKSGLTVDAQAIACGFSFFANKDFDKLVQCFAVDMGYTSSCALLWSHATGATAANCASQCLSQGDNNGPAPECKVNACINCTETVLGEGYDMILGRAGTASGLTNSIARDCSAFSPINHDYCNGTTPSCKTDESLTGPTTSIAANNFALSVPFFVLSFGFTLLQMHF